MDKNTARKWNWPWTDHRGRLDPWRSTALLALLFPGAWMAWNALTGGFGYFVGVSLIYWSGVWATGVLLAALFVSPAVRITGLRRLVTVRRIVGVSALFYSVVHLVLFLVFYRWDTTSAWGPQLAEQFARPTVIVATLATLGLAVLGATSFDGAIRRMGARNWRRLHRLTYLFTALAVLHYLMSPGVFSFQYTSFGLFAWLMAWRAAGRPDGLTALAGLALGSALATLTFEAVWMRVWQDIPMAETLGANIHWLTGVPATLSVLLSGLAVLVLATVATVARRRIGPGAGTA